MAKGYPDFFGTSIWPKYGTPIWSPEDIPVVAAGASVDVLTITGNGVLFSLKVDFNGTVFLDKSSVELWIDDSMIAEAGTRQDITYTSLGGHTGILSLTNYDALEFWAAIELGREVPFRRKIVVVVNNDSAADLDVAVALNRYIVT
jgi:hypothetical protein